MNKIQYNQTLKRMNNDIRQMRERIDVLKETMRGRMIERANHINSEFYKGE